MNEWPVDCRRKCILWKTWIIVEGQRKDCVIIALYTKPHWFNACMWSNFKYYQITVDYFIILQNNNGHCQRLGIEIGRGVKPYHNGSIIYLLWYRSLTNNTPVVSMTHNFQEHYKNIINVTPTQSLDTSGYDFRIKRYLINILFLSRFWSYYNWLVKFRSRRVI